MIPILYEATELNFTSNGVCRLAEATECHVTEERNGEYELTLTYPITGKYYDQIQEGMYIAATHDDQGDRQPFRIYRRSAPFNGLVQFFAHHISYMLNNIILNPITAVSAADAFDQMEQETVTTNPFTMWTDVTTPGNFETKTPASIRSVLGGSQGSIIDIYGGEFEWDMFTVKLHAQRGIDSGVTIRYGKNLTDLNQVIDAGGIYNAIVPYWIGDVNGEEVLVTLPEHYVAASGVTNPVMIVMDFTSEFEGQPTEAQLRSKATSFLSNNRPWIPSENIKISFVQLWQTEEYKNVAVLQRLSLCDRVNVYYPALGIAAESVEIIKTVYNVLLDRYDEMELGDARSNFSDTLIRPIEQAIEAVTHNFVSKTVLNQAIALATQLITGGMGGNIVFTFDANGWPIEELIMDTKDTSTAVNVWRWNLGGLGHSHSGYNGPFDDIAITQDGKINADMITVGTMSANRIKGGTLSLGGGTTYGNGVLSVYDASGNLIGQWNNLGISINKGTINIGNGNFVVDTNGNVTAKNITAENSGKISQFTFTSSALIYNSGGIAGSYDRSNKDKIYIGGNTGIAITHGSAENSVVIHNGEITMGTLNIPGMIIRQKNTVTNWWETFEIYDVKRQYAWLSYDSSPSSGYFDLDLTSQSFHFYDQSTGNTWLSYDRDSMSRKIIKVDAAYAITITGGSGGTKVTGNFTVSSGTKSRVVETDDYSNRLLYCYETPSPLFGDVGEGVIGDDGKCYVMIDSIFAETVNLSQYQVFLQKYGSGDCWVSERKSAYFVVEGTPGMSFGWELKAKQADFDQYRLEEDRDPVTPNNNEDYGILLTEHIEELRREREVA